MSASANVSGKDIFRYDTEGKRLTDLIYIVFFLLYVSGLKTVAYINVEINGL